MMHRKLFLALALGALVGAPAQAQDQLNSDPTLPTTRIGTRGATFLSLGVGARAQALAGAYGALANDATALFWNTAGITALEGFSAGLSQANMYDDLDIGHTFVGVVLPVGLNYFGLSVNVLSSGEMAWTEAAQPNPPPFGEDFNATRATFEWTGTAIGAHYARPITDRLSFGAAAKLIEEGIQGATAEYVALDLGTQFETGLYGITLGASLQNLGSEGQFEGKELTREIDTRGNESQLADFNRIIELRAGTSTLQLPTIFRFSVMADLIGSASSLISADPNQALRLVWDLNDAVDTDLQTALGLEYGFRDLAFLRVGKRWTNEAQIAHDFTRNASIGGGLRLPIGIGEISLDYAYTGMGDLENVQVFGLQLNF